MAISSHLWTKFCRKGFGQVWKYRYGSGKMGFSTGTELFQEHGRSEQTRLPTLIYVQNPITWLVNKIDFKMLKKAWDCEFDENEFKRGTKQAVSVISCMISENRWEHLEGLMTRQALGRLKREVETEWSDARRRHVALEPSDVKLALPRRVRFARIADRRSVYVDVVFVGLKFGKPENGKDVIFVELVARFHRNYFPDRAPLPWTVSLFKITGFHVEKGR